MYVYSLKDGINDGFLTPFKRQADTRPRWTTYTSTRPTINVVEGEIEVGRATYEEVHFNNGSSIIRRAREPTG